MKKRIFEKLLLILLLIIFGQQEVLASETLINGFVSQGYIKTDNNNMYTNSENGSFEFSETGIRFSTQLPDRLRIGMQLFARDLGDLGNNEITIDWAFADYLFTNELGVRAGILKIPHGLYNEIRDTDMLRASIFLPMGLYNEAWRDTFVSLKGIGIYGDLLNHCSYKFQVGIPSVSPESGMAKSFSSFTNSKVTDTNPESYYTASIQLYDIVEGLKLGFAGGKFNFAMNFIINENSAISLPGTNTGHIDGDGYVWTTSAEYIYNNITFSTEYGRFVFDLPITIDLQDTDKLQLFRSVNMETYYVNLSYRMTEWFEAGIYYSVTYNDKDDKKGKEYIHKFLGKRYSAWAKDVCISARFDINSNWVLKMETHINDGTNSIFNADNMNDAGELNLNRRWTAYIVKVSYNF